MNGWQPIETAPRDGSWFVCANFKNEVDACTFEIARFNPYYWEYFTDAGNGLFRKERELVHEFDANNWHRATHWMALPEPPAKLEEES